MLYWSTKEKTTTLSQVTNYNVVLKYKRENTTLSQVTNYNVVLKYKEKTTTLSQVTNYNVVLKYKSPWSGFELTTLVVIDADFLGYKI